MALARGYDVDKIRSKIARREKLETLWEVEEEAKAEEPVVLENSILFNRVATEWFNKNKSSWARDKTVTQMWRMLEVYCLPILVKCQLKISARPMLLSASLLFG